MVSALERERTLELVRRICLALPETSERLSHGAPTFFVPPYVGHRGWLGYRLDRGFETDELAGILEDAFAGRRAVEARGRAGHGCTATLSRCCSDATRYGW